MQNIFHVFVHGLFFILPVRVIIEKEYAEGAPFMMDMTLVETIIRLSISVLFYVVMTMLLWRLWSKREHSIHLRLLVGGAFGLCCILSTHVGVDYYAMVLNTRDIGPLAAGLLFDPLSGVVAGLIGGIERYIAGAYFGVGSFTRVACSVSTILAGLLSAFLNLKVYNRKHPPLLQTFLIGALMEDFHMYAVLITHRNQMRLAYYVVKTCAVPMIIFTGLGMGACMIAVLGLSGKLKNAFRIPAKQETPIAVRFQRWLLAVTLLIVMVNLYSSYHIQTRISDQQASSDLTSLSQAVEKTFRRDHRTATSLSEFLMKLREYEDVLFFTFNDDGKVLYSYDDNPQNVSQFSETDRIILQDHANKETFHASLNAFDGSELIIRSGTLTEHSWFMVGFYSELVYEDRQDRLYEEGLSDILLFSILYILIALIVDTLVGKHLRSVNHSLRKIIDGDLDEKIHIRDSREFAQLSDDINQTVDSLKTYIAAAEHRMEQELLLAAAIQESALPRVFSFPRNDFEIYALMNPARQVGGDFYDFFLIGADQLALVIADVSGKGIPASLFMMRSKTAIENIARTGKSPAGILHEVNHILCEGNDAEMFVTVWIGLIDLKTGRMQCANAGHEYPVLMHAGEKYELLRRKHSPALAILPELSIREYTVYLNPGDRLFVYTDGVPDAINPQEESYGTQRLVEKLNTLQTLPQAQVLHEVYQDIEQFAGSADQFDDITMIGFTYLPSS